MTTLRVATYNLYLGADLTLLFGAEDLGHLTAQAHLVHQQLLATDFPARAEAVASLIVRERVDVVGLQEVARWSLASLGPDGERGESMLWCDFLDELLGALDRAGAGYDAHAANPNFQGDATISADESMFVLGRNVVLVRQGSGVDVDRSVTGSYTRTLDIPTGMGEFTLSVARSWGWVDAHVRNRRFRFVNTHIEAHDADTRSAQRDELLHELGGPEMPVVVVGDFNAGPETVGMPTDYLDAWIASGGDPRGGHTSGQAADLANDQSLLNQRIDYIWVRNAPVDACTVIGDSDADRTTGANLWPSDHACVVAVVRL